MRIYSRTFCCYSF